MRSVRRPLTWHWLVLALLSLFVVFSLTAFVAAHEAQAKGKSDGGGGADRSGGGGDSGGGDPIGDAVGGATKQLDGGGGADRLGGRELLNDGGTGGVGGKKEGPLLSDSPLAANEPKSASADTKLVTEKASGDLLNQVSGKATDWVPSGESILKKDSPTTDPAPALAPTVGDTKDALEGAAQPVSGEPVPTTSETIRPLVGGVEVAAPATLTTATEPLIDETKRLTTQPASFVEGAPQLVDSALQGATKSTGAPLVETTDDLTSPITDQLGEATQQPLRIVDGAATPIREALGPVLENTAGPLLTTAEPLLEPGIGPVIGKVAPAVPLEGTLAAPTLREHIPAAELYAPVSGGIPALSPTAGPEPGTVAAFEPAGASVSAPLFEPSVAVSEGASLPVLQATEAPAMTLLPTVSSSVLGATGSTAITPSPVPNHAAGSAAAASGEIPASVVSSAIDAREGVGTVPGKSSHPWVAPLGSTVFGTTGLGGATTSWAKGFLVDDPSPFSPSTLPVAGSAIGGSGASGSGLGLGLLGALALILSLARVNTLLRSARETFGASSYLQLAIERPG
jgi:hypothetical protein